MYTKQTFIVNKLGLHARPASELVLLAKTFQSNVFIRNISDGSAPMNAKRIGSIMAGDYSQGMCVEISAEGTDEAEAVEKLIAAIDGGFGE